MLIKENTMKEQFKDIAVRALKTFVQAFLATLLAGVIGVVDVTSAKTLLIAAFAAGISATQNSIKEAYLSRK